MDRIELHGMSFLGRHGVREAERETDQEFRVDVDIDVDLSVPAASDQLTDTIDYTFVRAAAKEVIEGRPRRLVESLAGEIASRILEIPQVAAVSVRVAKFPASMQPIDSAAIRINRTRA